MLSFEVGTKQGRDPIRDPYAAFFAFHGPVASVETDRQVENDANLFVEFTVRSERGEFQLLNAFVLDGGTSRTSGRSRLTR